MIKRVFCKSNYKGFKKGKIYETCYVEDDYTGNLVIFEALVDSDLKIWIDVVDGKLIDTKHFKLIRHCYEEYECMGTLGALMDC